MKNMKSKTKTLLAIGFLAIVCMVLIAAIYSKFQPEPREGTAIPPSSTVSGDIVTTSDAIKPVETAEKKDEIVVKPIEPTPLQSDTTAQDANKIVQTNVPEAVKPEPPAKPTPQGDVTNPAKPPEYKPEDTNVSKQTEPKAGEKKDGKIYVPGFGWIKDEGGGGKGTVVDGDGDINKQVGNMD